MKVRKEMGLSKAFFEDASQLKKKNLMYAWGLSDNGVKTIERNKELAKFSQGTNPKQTFVIESY